MKSDEIIEAAKGVEAAVETDVKNARGWLKSALDWAWSTSWKTKAVVGVILLTGLLWGMTSAYRGASDYITKSEASVMLSARTTGLQTSIDAMSKRLDAVESDLHQAQIELHAAEDKLSAKKIITGSIKKRRSR